MTSIVGIYCSPGGGGTFLDWSLYKLAGQKQYLHIDIIPKTWDSIRGSAIDPVVNNPLRVSDSHSHMKNHPTVPILKETTCLLNNLEQPAEHVISSYYISDLLGKSFQRGDFSYGENKQVEMALAFPDTKFIMFDLDEQSYDYIFMARNDRVPHCNHYLLETKEKYITNSTIADQRERAAVNYVEHVRNETTHKGLGLDNVLVISHNNLTLGGGLKELKKIFDFINVEMNTSIIDEWNEIYKDWIKQTGCQFRLDLDNIVDDIINGVERDLTPYNITLAKEAVILNKLLYKHNINITNSVPLSVMPLNTIGWHKTLEENTYYNLRNNA